MLTSRVPKMQNIADITWAGVAGLCGGVVYLIVQKHITPRTAVSVCVVSTMFGIFVGDLVAKWLGWSQSGAGFLCGIGSMRISIWIADGSALDWLRRLIERRQPNNNGHD